MVPLPGEHTISAGTFGTTSPSETARSLAPLSSRFTSLDPGAPLQYRSLISEVTSKPRPRAWIVLERVVVKASELEVELLAAIGKGSLSLMGQEKEEELNKKKCSIFSIKY